MAQSSTLVRPPLQDATRQIRLLQLQLDDRRGRGDRVIHCTLDVHFLEDVVGQYVAVSYTWGGTDETHTVLVNGQKCQVRYNCWQALDQLKQHGIQEYCFVDSICIDQGSHREKRQQVGQMSTIYSGAKFVAASLGGKAAGQEKAMRLFSSDMLSLHADPKEWVQMLHHISERRYFTRVWTTQECILAQRVEFFCGRSRVPLQTLETKLKQQTRAVLGLAMLTQLTSFLDDCSKLRGQQSDLRGLSLYNVIDHGTSLLHPATAIIRYGVRECVDPRDKIFGLHSLMFPAARARIDIDYELPLFDVLLKYIDSHECLVDQNAHEALDNGHGDETHDATSLGEVMLSIRLLSHQFAATSPEFRRSFKDFCSRKIKRYDHRRETPDTNIPVVICPALYHNITTESHVAHEDCDMILRSDQGDRLLQRGLRPVVPHPSMEGDWKFHQACSCCETERPQFTKAHLKDLACVRASSNDSNLISSSDSHRLLYKRHRNKDAGLVFQVPKETSNGDILLFIGSYNPTS
ncbi:Heterokaryon incompatibility protein 6, OR allele [Pseudocercospora fuligena]|uniref:Heterokaryon incompatibility protein 6, OR allele n=1 Tax=Pseudocercospora fuligena TaxID=685502 RepID=A0A8H6VLF4_9PEZI|nr:Heterokaryon incompatibility protein 6, OR allele [Pseudocercospora fuligena]